MAETQVTGTGNLVAIKEPKFLSMVCKPANKMAFKVVRSEEGETHMKSPVVRRQRRSEQSPIMRMQFPVGYTDEQVTDRMAAFGLAGYSVESSADGIIATRSDLKSISPDTTTSIRLTADGIVAMVARGEQPAENPKSQIAVVSLAFRADKFDAAQVQDWLKANGMDTPVISPEGAGDFIVQRAEVQDGEETRTVQIEDGVSATIVRADTMSVPDGYVAVVNETAYGNWGWGQLDFSAAMADEEFCDVMDEALYRLRDVLRNILLYSALPLADRKLLMVNALEQFKGFSVSILDSLPRQVLVAVVRSASNQLEKVQMSNSKNSGAATTQPAATVPAEQPITRAEIATIAAEAATAAIKALGLVARSEVDEPKKEEPTGAAGVVTTPAATEASITREDMKAMLGEVVAPLVERLKQVEGATVLRSDGGDAKVEVTGTGGEAKSKDVFRGASAFQGLGLPNRAAK